MADKTSSHYFYILLDRGRALGYIWLEIKQYQESAFKKSTQSVYVHQLSIIKEAQRNGLGTLLMDKVCKLRLNTESQKLSLITGSIMSMPKGSIRNRVLKNIENFYIKI